jgi:hypothetical protein
LIQTQDLSLEVKARHAVGSPFNGKFKIAPPAAALRRRYPSNPPGGRAKRVRDRRRRPLQPRLLFLLCLLTRGGWSLIRPLFQYQCSGRRVSSRKADTSRAVSGQFSTQTRCAIAPISLSTVRQGTSTVFRFRDGEDLSCLTELTWEN